MKKKFISAFILVFGLTVSYISFNHISAWLGFILTILTIVLFGMYSFKHLKY